MVAVDAERGRLGVALADPEGHPAASSVSTQTQALVLVDVAEEGAEHQSGHGASPNHREWCAIMKVRKGGTT